MNMDIGPDTFVLKGPEYRRLLAAENENVRLRAALAAAQAGAADRKYLEEEGILDAARAQGFAAGIEATADKVLDQPGYMPPGERAAIIRALRPPAETAESEDGNALVRAGNTSSNPGAGCNSSHTFGVEQGPVPLTLPLSASEPEGPSEEDVIAGLTELFVRTPDATTKEIAQTVLALLQRGKK